MTIICEEEYQEWLEYLSLHVGRMSDPEITLIHLALDEGRAYPGIPDSMATACRGVIHRIWLELYRAEGGHGDRRVPYPNRWWLEKK